MRRLLVRSNAVMVVSLAGSSHHCLAINTFHDHANEAPQVAVNDRRALHIRAWYIRVTWDAGPLCWRWDHTRFCFEAGGRADQQAFSVFTYRTPRSRWHQLWQCNVERSVWHLILSVRNPRIKWFIFCSAKHLSVVCASAMADCHASQHTSPRAPHRSLILGVAHY